MNFSPHAGRQWLLAATFLVSAALGGCGPVSAASAISDGTKQLEAAERSEAEKHARYHYTKARLLLTEAKRRNGYGEYEVARQWAEEAAGLANEAYRTARARQELQRRKERTLPKVVPKSTPKTTPDPKKNKPEDKTAPDEKRPLTPPPTRRRILPPSMGGGK